MSFFDGKYTSFNEWNWSLYENNEKTDIDKFLIHYASKSNTEFYIGTDSQNYSRKDKKFCHFSTVIVACDRGHGANAIFHREKTEFVPNIHQRLLTEAMMSLEAAWYVTKIIGGDKHVICIHLDVNDNVKFKSSAYKDELVGLVSGQGFFVEHKPNSWAASTIADSKC